MKTKTIKVFSLFINSKKIKNEYNENIFNIKTYIQHIYKSCKVPLHVGSVRMSPESRWHKVNLLIYGKTFPARPHNNMYPHTLWMFIHQQLHDKHLFIFRTVNSELLIWRDNLSYISLEPDVLYYIQCTISFAV